MLYQFFIEHCCIFVYALHDLYMKLHSFNFTYTMIMKCLLQTMNFFSCIAHIACLVLYLVESCVAQFRCI